ncbi:MAG: competence/damage-inducible protein A [Balneola sp.]
MGKGIKNFNVMKVQIISIGNELLIGDTINTNASWMGEFMTSLGFEVTEVHTISDELELIKSTITRSMEVSDVVLCTGGLGPTHDDITKAALAELFNMSMISDESVLEHIKKLFESRNIPFSKSNHAQAEVPENCEVLFNKMGTAPGMWFHENDCYLACMPGVPFEMKYLMKNPIAEKLREVFGDVGFLYSRYLKTVGIGESTLSDTVIGNLSDFFVEGVSLAFLPMAGGVTLRLNGKGSTKQEARDSVNKLANHIYEKASKYIIGEGKYFTVSESVGEILKAQNKIIATAESCTGGMIANELTNIAGSSAYVLGGIVSYSNEVKIKQLGVSKDDLQKVGAVSKEVALQMAKGVAEKLGSDIGISTTGVAGPGGGSEDKPVGTVWIGYWSKDEHFAVKALFTKDRLLNKERSMRMALEITRRVLNGIEEMPYNLEKQYR